MPNQVPWSDCVHCNNKMLAAHKHNASALFRYTQRSHGPRAAIKTSGARAMICSVRSCWKEFVTCFPLFSFSPLAIVSKIIIKMPFNFEGMTMSETLTQDQIAFYQENGYLVLENQIPDSWMHRIRREISRFEDEAALLSESNERLDLEDTHTKNAPRLRRIKLPHTISTDLKELMLSDYILGPARDLAGPNLRLHTSKLNMKSAGYGAAVEWHQDYAFYPHTNDDILAIGVIIDDMASENGPLMVYPGSHKGPVYDHHVDGVFAGAMLPSDNGLDAKDAVSLMGPAGSISIHHGRIVHGSSLNTSDRARRILFYEMMAADAFPLMGSMTRWEGIKDYDDRMLCGRPTLNPRLKDIPVRIPQPQPDVPISIYEIQKGMKKRAFDVIDGPSGQGIKR